MAKKFITLTGFLLKILAILTVIHPDAAGAQTLGAGSLGVETARMASAPRMAAWSISQRVQVVEWKQTCALEFVSLKVVTGALSGKSMSLLDT